jgi:predicted porin
MQKKLIALAIASAFAAPGAFAATSHVDIYGTIDLSMAYVDTGISGVDKSFSLVSNVSRIGFKGSEDLGGGMSAIWQVETNLYPDGMSSNSFTSLRNSFVGLHGNWGTFLMGKHDTPVKLLGRSVDNFGNSLADSRNLLGADYYYGKPEFDLRAPNVIAYGTPNFSGVSALLAYVTSVGTTGNCAASQGDTNFDCNKLDAYSGYVKYENGPLMVGGGYEKHNFQVNGEGDTPTTDESIWRLVGSYTIGDFKLAAQYDNSDDSNAVYHYQKRDGYGLFANYTLGNVVLKANYLKAGGVSGVSSSDAHQWTVGADYNLSKRTTIYGFYAKVNNGDNSWYGMGVGAGTSKSIHNWDTDPSTFSVGLRHSF